MPAHTDMADGQKIARRAFCLSAGNAGYPPELPAPFLPPSFLCLLPVHVRHRPRQPLRSCQVFMRADLAHSWGFNARSFSHAASVNMPANVPCILMHSVQVWGSRVLSCPCPALCPEGQGTVFFFKAWCVRANGAKTSPIRTVTAWTANLMRLMPCGGVCASRRLRPVRRAGNP